MSDLNETELKLLSLISDNLNLVRESMGHFNTRMETQENMGRQTLVSLAILTQRMDNTDVLVSRMDKIEERLREAETSVKGAGIAATFLSKLWPFAAGLAGGVAGYLGFNQT